jgi:asparagine synthetase B (glutamine-hydrolysing)
MSGIYGFTNQKPIDNPRDLLVRMRNALPTQGHTNRTEWIGNKKDVGLGAIHPTAVAMRSHYAREPARGVYCVFDGIVHVPSETYSDEADNLTGAELLLKAFLESDSDCVQQCSGSFNVAWWDEKNRRLVLATDKLGQRLLFYSQRNNGFAFASYLARIVASGIPSKKINIEAFADLLNFEYILGERTLFKDIQTLPPGSVLIYENGQINIKPYFQLHRIEPHGRYDSSRLDELSDLFKTAVRRSIRTNVSTAIDLTGGLDSRCILSAAAHMQLPVTAHTGGQTDSTDVILAKEAAAVTQIDHFFEPVTAEKMAAWLRPMVLYQGGMVASLHSHPCQHFEMAMPFNAAVQGIGISYVRGQWVTSSDLVESNPKLIKKRLMERLLSSTAKKNDLAMLWKPEFKQNGFQKSRGHLDEIFQQYIVYDRAIDIIDHVAWVERCRKFLNKAIFIVRGVREVYFPFLDHEFMIALARIPKSDRVSIKIQVDLIRRFFPKLLEVPWAKTLIPLSASPARAWLIQKSRAVQRRGSRLFGLADRTPKKKPNHYLAQWCRKEMRAALNDLLYSPTAAFRDYLDWKAIEPLLNQHFSGKDNWEHLLASLTVFEVANQLWVQS